MSHLKFIGNVFILSYVIYIEFFFVKLFFLYVPIPSTKLMSLNEFWVVHDVYTPYRNKLVPSEMVVDVNQVCPRVGPPFLSNGLVMECVLSWDSSPLTAALTPWPEASR